MDHLALVMMNWMRVHKKLLILAAAVILLALIIALVLRRCVTAPAAAGATPTMEAPDALTAKHGDEVTAMIESFEVRGHTVKMYSDPAYHAEIYTGPYLDYIDGYYLSFDDTTLWPIVSQATVTQIRVLEYSRERIRALACVTEEKLDLNAKGRLVAQEPVSVVNGAYVFQNVGGTWKVASFLDLSAPETARLEYAMMNNDLKQITGDFASLNGLNCKE